MQTYNNNTQITKVRPRHARAVELAGLVQLRAEETSGAPGKNNTTTTTNNNNTIDNTNTNT